MELPFQWPAFFEWPVVYRTEAFVVASGACAPRAATSQPRHSNGPTMMEAMVPWLPPDVWFAIAAAVAVLLFGMAEPAGVLVTAYVAMCAYVAYSVFRRS
jgi:hypothetical protein